MQLAYNQPGVTQLVAPDLLCYKRIVVKASRQTFVTPTSGAGECKTQIKLNDHTLSFGIPTLRLTRVALKHWSRPVIATGASQNMQLSLQTLAQKTFSLGPYKRAKPLGRAATFSVKFGGFVFALGEQQLAAVCCIVADCQRPPGTVLTLAM